MKSIIKLISFLVSSVYPNKCICCSEFIEEGSYLCDDCDNNLERNDLEKICLSCGFETDDCVCRYNVYRFDGLICVFKNKNLARSAYYSYKFGKRQHYEKFFAEEMCAAVKKCYENINFDLVCAVPPVNKFGYDHSGYLARRMADILKIKYADGLLSCVKRTKKQHKSSIKERLINTEGKYNFNYRVENACVLLVDDIKTTGATIDECAKMLLYAGADSVYCVTALGADTKN